MDPGQVRDSGSQTVDFRSEFQLDVAPGSITGSGLRRSASSAGTTSSSRPRGPGGAPIAKPVRRSKSQLQRTTHIHHGGPITFVSVNNSDKVGGAHTLPRRKPAASDVVISRQMSSGGNGVRIQIGGQGNKGSKDSSSSTMKSAKKERRKYTLEELEVERDDQVRLLGICKGYEELPEGIREGCKPVTPNFFP